MIQVSSIKYQLVIADVHIITCCAMHATATSVTQELRSMLSGLSVQLLTVLKFELMLKLCHVHQHCFGLVIQLVESWNYYYFYFGERTIRGILDHTKVTVISAYGRILFLVVFVLRRLCYIAAVYPHYWWQLLSSCLFWAKVICHVAYRIPPPHIHCHNIFFQTTKLNLFCLYCHLRFVSKFCCSSLRQDLQPG